mmetsp:Transcript_15458/g.49408  ORF Transcript_15458/g.49408 Transcript_15458/m.49408 type:complete len:254 (-) Transcript_15458:2-763(-)
MNGSFPPNSSTSGFSPPAQADMMRLPVAEEPVIATMSTSGDSTSRCPTAPSPCTSPTSPEGRPACSASTAAWPERGATSDGLTTTAFPAASAGMASTRISSTGKFQGAQIATTPCASRTRMEDPPISCGMLAARTFRTNSSLSAAPSTSSVASERIFPISRTHSSATETTLGVRDFTAAAIRSHRSESGVCSHDGCAAFAACSASSTTAGVLIGTRAMTLPSAGFVSTMWSASMITPCTIRFCTPYRIGDCSE